MPEIKNQRAIAKVTHHIIDFSIKSCAASQKSKWIGIALHGDT